MDHYEINGLQLPPLLIELLHQGKWHHPGDESLRNLIPFLREPVAFLTTMESMHENTSYSDFDPDGAAYLREVRGSMSSEPILLPWLDVDLSVFIAVSTCPGDDLGIALDYRTDKTDPRVVANDWHGGGRSGCVWREVAQSFSQFIDLLGIQA